MYPPKMMPVYIFLAITTLFGMFGGVNAQYCLRPSTSNSAGCLTCCLAEAYPESKDATSGTDADAVREGYRLRSGIP